MSSKERPTPEQFLMDFPVEIQHLANELRALVKSAVPEHVEAVYPGWSLIGCRIKDGRRSAYFGFIATKQDGVVLGFEFGILLDDPTGGLEGIGKQVRQAILKRPEDVLPVVLNALIVQASEVALLTREEKAGLMLEREASLEAKRSSQ
jgi:hypothetical protein